jgi:hypothetical protein
MPITLNNSNISVTYNTGSNYIIETVKSDLYVRGTTSGNLSPEPTVSPSIRSDIVVETFTYTTGTTQTTYDRNFSEDTLCDILIVGGGGGGGNFGGGGGGGAILFINDLLLNVGNYTIKVGNGGIGASNNSGNGSNGTNSSITINSIEYIAKGGGGGGSRQGSGNGRSGNDGGSGGGGSQTDFSTSLGLGGSTNKNTYTNWESYGNAGGNGRDGASPWTHGGGGGAGSGGSSGSDSKGGNGGLGKNFISYFGTNVGHNGWFGGGGGGGVYYPGIYYDFGYGNGGNGLFGGGGKGASEAPGEISATDGLSNTGGGGGGGKFNGDSIKGGNGGSGIVIIRYRSLAAAPTSVNMVKTLNFNYYSSLSPTIYTLTFNTRTLASINNGSDKLLNGSYTITLGNTLSTIVPTTANQNLQDTKYSSSTISVSYHTLNPILDTKGAQWTYSSTNPNVYHLGSVGIGTTSPEYSLDVRGNIFTSVGGYTQTGTENWIIQSDRRIKENIVKASYEKCLENVKKIELYNFNFKENYVNTNDRNQLGFIAQEVQEVYPKAVIVKPDENIEELLTVNTTQIKYTLYGAVRSLIEKVERIEERVDKLYKLAIPDVEIKEITSKITEIFESTSNIILPAPNIP